MQPAHALWQNMLITQDCFKFHGRKAYCMTEISCKQTCCFPRCIGKNNLDFVPSLVAIGMSNICYSRLTCIHLNPLFLLILNENYNLKITVYIVDIIIDMSSALNIVKRVTVIRCYGSYSCSYLSPSHGGGGGKTYVTQSRGMSHMSVIFNLGMTLEKTLHPTNLRGRGRVRLQGIYLSYSQFWFFNINQLPT